MDNRQHHCGSVKFASVEQIIVLVLYPYGIYGLVQVIDVSLSVELFVFILLDVYIYSAGLYMSRVIVSYKGTAALCCCVIMVNY